MIAPNFHKAAGLEHHSCRTHHHSLLKLHSIDLLQVKNRSLLPRLFETLWPLTSVVTTLISQYATDLYLHSLWELLKLRGAGCDIGSDPSALTHDPNQLVTTSGRPQDSWICLAQLLDTSPVWLESQCSFYPRLMDMAVVFLFANSTNSKAEHVFQRSTQRQGEHFCGLPQI